MFSYQVLLLTVVLLCYLQTWMHSTTGPNSLVLQFPESVAWQLTSYGKVLERVGGRIIQWSSSVLDLKLRKQPTPQIVCKFSSII